MQKKESISAVSKGLSLPLMEAFYTLQGEGYHKGSAAYFIRIGGCDVGCHWCDVKESWNADLHPPTQIDSIVAKAKKIFRYSCSYRRGTFDVENGSFNRCTS